MTEENNQEEQKKKKLGLGRILFKLITLGGLLLIVFKFFKKQKQESEEK